MIAAEGAAAAESSRPLEKPNSLVPRIARNVGVLSDLVQLIRPVSDKIFQECKREHFDWEHVKCHGEQSSLLQYQFVFIDDSAPVELKLEDAEIDRIAGRVYVIRSLEDFTWCMTQAGLPIDRCPPAGSIGLLDSRVLSLTEYGLEPMPTEGVAIETDPKVAFRTRGRSRSAGSVSVAHEHRENPEALQALAIYQYEFDAAQSRESYPGKVWKGSLTPYYQEYFVKGADGAALAVLVREKDLPIESRTVINLTDAISQATSDYSLPEDGIVVAIKYAGMSTQRIGRQAPTQTYNPIEGCHTVKWVRGTIDRKSVV